MKKYPNLNYNILGIANESPKWNYDFYKGNLNVKWH